MAIMIGDINLVELVISSVCFWSLPGLELDSQSLANTNERDDVPRI